MNFSATGHLLRGSVRRPDMITIGAMSSSDPWPEKTASSANVPTSKLHIVLPENCSLNLYSHIFLIGNLTGLVRLGLGIVHTIVHLTCSIVSKYRKDNLEEARLGMENIGRGLIEIIPIIGTLVMRRWDAKRLTELEAKTKAAINDEILNSAIEVKKLVERSA